MTDMGLKTILNAIHIEYTCQLEKTLSEIAGIAATLNTHPEQLQTLRTLKREFHTLKGSAPSFGLKELGRVAADADSFLELHTKSEAAFGKDECIQLQHLIAQMTLAAASRQTTMPGAANPSTHSPALNAQGTDLFYRTNQAQIVLGFVYSITDKGHDLLVRSGALLPQIEQELLVRIDGRTTPEQLILDMPHAGEFATERTLERMVERGLIEKTNFRVPEDNNLDFTASFGSPAKKTSLSTSEKTGFGLEAVRGASQLALDGYYISIARRAVASRPPRNGSTHALLVIEDDPMTAKLLKLLFAGEGFEVVTAGNRKEILTALSQKPLPDAVLLDVLLPDTNGFVLLAKMRAHPRLRELPVIMLTAAASRDDVLQGLLNGADGYVTKPFDMDRVVSAVCDVLGLESWSVTK